MSTVKTRNLCIMKENERQGTKSKINIQKVRQRKRERGSNPMGRTRHILKKLDVKEELATPDEQSCTIMYSQVQSACSQHTHTHVCSTNTAFLSCLQNNNVKITKAKLPLDLKGNRYLSTKSNIVCYYNKNDLRRHVT
jgi:hypothetical protein